MISTKQTKLSSRTDARLMAYAAAAGSVLAASVAVPTTKAAVVYVDPPDIAVPHTFDGIYLNLVTGETGVTTDDAVTYDINVWGVNGLNFAANFTADNPSQILLTPDPIYTFGTAMALQPGYLIGPDEIYDFGAYGTQFHVSGTEFLGIAFTNETNGTLDYGWIELATTGDDGTGFPATITRWAYDDSGAAILAGAVPEPTTTATLGLGALSLGATGLRRWRRSKQAAA